MHNESDASDNFNSATMCKCNFAFDTLILEKIVFSKHIVLITLQF